MIVKITMHHDRKGWHSIIKRIDKARYKRLLEKVGEKEGAVELVNLEILEK